MTWAPGLPVAALLLVACGSDAASPSALERGIADGLRTSLRPANLRVRCGPAPVTACLATADGIDLVVLVERDVKLGERWRLAEPVVTTVPIADYVTRELAALGVTTAVDCGPSLVPALAGGVITCALGTGGRAWARLRPDGSFVLDVALDTAEVQARDADADPAALDLRSRSLDSDEATGVEEPDEPGDAGGSGSATP